MIKKSKNKIFSEMLFLNDIKLKQLSMNKVSLKKYGLPASTYRLFILAVAL